MKPHPRCAAIQASDQMHCPSCRLTWDISDPAPPICKLTVDMSAVAIVGVDIGMAEDRTGYVFMDSARSIQATMALDPHQQRAAQILADSCPNLDRDVDIIETLIAKGERPSAYAEQLPVLRDIAKYLRAKGRSTFGDAA